MAPPARGADGDLRGEGVALGSGEAIERVNHDDSHLASNDSLAQLLQSRAGQGAARVAGKRLRVRVATASGPIDEDAAMQHDLGDLLQLLDADENDDVGTILGFTADAVLGQLEVRMRLEGYDREPEHRVVECGRAVRWVLSDACVYGVELSDDHPGLLDFTDDRGDLYFTDAPDDPLRVAASLREAHAAVVGPYLEFEEVVNTEVRPLSTLLDGGHGKLASGPVTLLRQFQDLLESNGSRTSLLSVGDRKVYVEREMNWVTVPAQLSLLDLGESWIVAERFTVRPAQPQATGE